MGPLDIPSQMPLMMKMTHSIPDAIRNDPVNPNDPERQ